MLASTVCLALGLPCCGGGDPAGFEPMDFETFVDGKEDTGYVSNKAAELEARITSSVFLDTTGKSQAEIDSLAARLRSPSRWTLQEYTTPQLKYARNPLKTEKLDLNLEHGQSAVRDVRVVQGGIWLDYTTSIESLVKLKDLADKGLTPADLIGKRVDFQFPARPASVFAQGGVACASDPDGDALDPGELSADNYFYYFDPAKDGCPLVAGVDLAAAQYEILSSLDSPNVYPEYDLLTQDKKIRMVVLFGQITHGDLTRSDWGWTGYNQFKRSFTSEGFRVIETFENDFGHRLSKTYPGGLEVVVDFYTPEALKDHRPREEVNQLFKAALRENEIVYYNGHAFYGSLNVLDQPDSYPHDTYQIIFMDACWSYAYYTKQVFSRKATAGDPDGMRFADVVNNTEPGITGSHETAWLMYKNLFQAASLLMQGKPVARYSWNQLVVYMNDSADRRARYYDPAEFHAEIYGVSGVRGNCFNPDGPSHCQAGGGTSLKHAYSDDSGETAIPDNQAAGIQRSLVVPDAFEVAQAAVTVDIRHGYVGDLRVSLVHGGVTHVLHDRAGGGADDLRTTFAAPAFTGASAAGDWTLVVADLAAYDTGKLVTWSLELTEGGGGPGNLSGESEARVDIPDNNPAGASSSVTLAGAGLVAEVLVHARISHTYAGDLVVRLEHAGQSAVLQSREGGSARNLERDYAPVEFADLPAEGEWRLVVVDEAAADTGAIEGWSLTVVTR
jgi:subtilisin-like proprotein convertase family protein